jgi:integrase
MSALSADLGRPPESFRLRSTGSDQAEGCPRLVRGDSDRPAQHAIARLRPLRTVMASAVNDELIDANPARIVGAGRSKRVHKIRPGSIEELGTLTAEMPDKLRLMVTLASWCALRFGEAVELRRGDVDLSQEVIRIRRAAVRTKGAYTITTPKSERRVA